MTMDCTEGEIHQRTECALPTRPCRCAGEHMGLFANGAMLIRLRNTLCSSIT